MKGAAHCLSFQNRINIDNASMCEVPWSHHSTIQSQTLRGGPRVDLPPCWALRCSGTRCPWRGGCAASWPGPAGRAWGTWAGPGRSPAPSPTATGGLGCDGRSAGSTPAALLDRGGWLPLPAPGRPGPHGRWSGQCANPRHRCRERTATRGVWRATISL